MPNNTTFHRTTLEGLHIDNNGIPVELALQTYTVLTRAKWEKIKDAAEKFFNEHADEEIDKYNDRG